MKATYSELNLAPGGSATAIPSPRKENRELRFLKVKHEMHQHLISSMDVSSAGSLSATELQRELRRGIEDLCRFRGELLSESERERLIEEIVDETLGFGPLEPLLRDATVSDILVNGPNVVYVERRGRLERTKVAFDSEEHLLEIVRRIATRVGRRLDESSPMVDARMPDGGRLNAVIRPLAINGALVSIRRFSAKGMMAADFVARQSMSREMVDFLAACVEARRNIVISGGTGSGKSTLLNMLSSCIPDDERIVTIEDAAELQLQQSHVASMETRCANLEGGGAISARELLRNALRMRPDRIIVGECRGEEAFDMLQAMTTGHDGSLTTLHANNARDALRRLELLVGMAGYDLPARNVRELIASAVNIVVHCTRVAGGHRRVVQIAEITGIADDVIQMHDLFLFEQRGIDDSRAAVGDYVATGIQPQCLPDLMRGGCGLPTKTFQARRLQIDRCDELSLRTRAKQVKA
jgi:pilus assembly protein CpaF